MSHNDDGVNAAVRANASKRARQLTTTLERIEIQWSRQDVPIARHLSPGLTNQQIDEIMAPTGIRLNEVHRALFRWHDGAMSNDPDLSRDSRDTALFGMLQFRSLAGMVEYWQGPWVQQGLDFARDITDELGPHGPWGPNWFPLLYDAEERSPIVTRSTQARWGDQETIWKSHLYESHDLVPRMVSLVALFQFLQVWLEHGYMRWDQDVMDWAYDDSIDKATYRATWWW